MNIKFPNWELLSAYLFIDRKLDSHGAVYLKSRFRLIERYYLENNIEFTRATFNNFITTKKAAGYKNSYINNIIKVGVYLHDYFLLVHKYDSGMGGYTYFTKEKVIYQIMSQEEYSAIISFDYPYARQRERKNAVYQAVFLTLITTGMRIGELINLKWADVNEEAITIRQTKTNVDRMIPNNLRLWKALQVIKQYQANDYVFPARSENENHIGEKSILQDLYKRKEAVGIKRRIWLHLFRHTFAVTMLRRNDYPVVSKILGHDNINSTMTYTHYLIEDMKLAINTHPLLTEVQTMNSLEEQVRKFVEKIIDKSRFRLNTNNTGEELTINLSVRKEEL